MRRRAKNEEKGAKSALTPSKKLEGEVLRGERRGFWGRGGGERLGGEGVLGRSVCGACVCLAGGKEKEEENRNWVVSGSRLPSLRLVSPSNSVAGGVRGGAGYVTLIVR